MRPRPARVSWYYPLYPPKKKGIKNLVSGPAIGQPLSPSERCRLVPDQLSSEGDLGGEETGGSVTLNVYLRAMLETSPRGSQVSRRKDGCQLKPAPLSLRWTPTPQRP